MTIQLGVLADAAGIGRLSPEQRVTPIAGLEYDSRIAGPGTGFFAFEGVKFGARQRADDALRRGAAVIFSELPAPADFEGVWIRVPYGRRALALMARQFFPAVAELRLTGITGTNGKTTTCYLLDTILRVTGHTTGQVGTIEYHVAGEVRKAANTTPESLDLYRLFDELRRKGGSHATMEVSSHALSLGRVWGLRFAVAVFTNLTQDHLDFHPTMEDYFDAKNELFRGQDAEPPETAVLNADDEWAHRLELRPATRAIWYGIGGRAALRAVDVAMDFSGLRFEVEWEGRRWPVRSPLTGRFNVHNILAAFGAGLAHGLEPGAIAAAIAERQAVPGRFERVEAGQPFLVVVDYSHTGDALRNAIQAARALTQGRVITLFGCGGDRDRSKRPLMGMVAARLSDVVVITSDNPRTEDPARIIEEILRGIPAGSQSAVRAPSVKSLVDRAEAIEWAVATATPGDVVLVAGKGHEKYQQIGDRVLPFDDGEVARTGLARRRPDRSKAG